jgi:hypothetical protein
VSTIIDSLIVTLGLDSKQLDTKSCSAGKTLKGLEEQSGKTEKSVKKIGETSKATATGLDTLTRSLGSFLALLGGTVALRAFVEDTIASNAALDRFSKNLSLSVETVSAWGNAVEELGGSAKGLQGSMDMLSKAQTELRLTGQSSLIPYFSALGVSLATVGGQARPVDDILLDLSERFSHLDRTTANNLGRMIGLDQDTLNLLLKGRTEVELTIKRQKESTAVTKAQAEESSKLQRSMIDLRQSFAATGRELLQQASPALEKFFGILKSFGDWVSANKEFVGDFLTVIAVGLGAIALASLPLTSTVAAVVALGAAIALVWQDYQTWKRGGESFIDWGKWEPAITAATKGIDALRGAIDKLWESYKNYYEKTTGHKFSVGGFIDDTKAVLGVAATTNPAALKSNFAPGKSSLDTAIAKVEGFYAKGQKANRPQRNHNPGDLEYGDFAKAHGATGTDGRFAIFPDDATGFAALHSLLQTQGYSNLTIEQAIGKFAPPKENDTAKYVRDVSRSTALAPTTTVGQALAGIQGASSSVATAGGSGPSSSSTDKSVTVQTGDINIHTAATDAKGIAQDFGKSMNFLFTSQANAGLF